MRIVLVALMVLTVAGGTLIAAPTSVPEIDPSSVPSVLALLAGGCLLAVSKYRSRK